MMLAKVLHEERGSRDEEPHTCRGTGRLLVTLGVDGPLPLVSGRETNRGWRRRIALLERRIS